MRVEALLFLNIVKDAQACLSASFLLCPMQVSLAKVSILWASIARVLLKYSFYPACGGTVMKDKQGVFCWSLERTWMSIRNFEQLDKCRENRLFLAKHRGIWGEKRARCRERLQGDTILEVIKIILETDSKAAFWLLHWLAHPDVIPIFQMSQQALSAPGWSRGEPRRLPLAILFIGGSCSG